MEYNYHRPSSLNTRLATERETGKRVSSRPGLSLATETEATEYIIHSVENCFEVLGESGKFTYLKIMQTQYGIPISQVPYDPHEFVKALRELFGYTATVFEQRILEEFSGLPYTDEAISECVRNFALVLREDLNANTVR